MAPDDFPAGGYLRDYVGFWVIWLAILAGTVLFFRRTRGRHGRWRLICGNLLVFASLAWTAVLAAETWLRYVYDTTDQYALMLTNFSWFRRHVHLNPDGFRDSEFANPKPRGVTRVGFVGDSFTMGWGIREPRDTFPQRVGSALEGQRPGAYEVRNLGYVGYTTGHEARLVDIIAPRYVLDHVVLAYCLNDVDDLLPPDRWLIRESLPRIPWIEPTRSFLADFLWYRLRLRNDPRVRGFFDWEIEAYEDPIIWSRQRERFRHIASKCKALGIRLDVVVFPFLNAWGENYRFAGCHDRVVAAWKELGVEAIDLRGAYRGVPGSDLVVNRFDAHPNERAHEIAARVILDRVFGVR